MVQQRNHVLTKSSMKRQSGERGLSHLLARLKDNLVNMHSTVSQARKSRRSTAAKFERRFPRENSSFTAHFEFRVDHSYRR